MTTPRLRRPQRTRDLHEQDRYPGNGTVHDRAQQTLERLVSRQQRRAQDLDVETSQGPTVSEEMASWLVAEIEADAKQLQAEHALRRDVAERFARGLIDEAALVFSLRAGVVSLAGPTSSDPRHVPEHCRVVDPGR